MVRELRKCRVFVDIADHKGRTPVSYAAEQGHDHVLTALLFDEETGPAQADKLGRTPLMYAAARGNLNAVETLLRFYRPGDDIDARDNVTGQTALIYATKADSNMLVEALLEEGADQFIRCHDGRLAIDHAIKQGNQKLVELFLTRDETWKLRPEYRRLMDLAQANGFLGVLDELEERVMLWDCTGGTQDDPCD